MCIFIMCVQKTCQDSGKLTLVAFTDRLKFLFTEDPAKQCAGGLVALS